MSHGHSFRNFAQALRARCERCPGAFPSGSDCGSERSRTLVVEQFRGVLSRLEDENIVRFETEIHDGGFDISNVRKIR